MLLALAEYLKEFHSGVNLFQNLTLRAIIGTITAIVL